MARMVRGKGWNKVVWETMPGGNNVCNKGVKNVQIRSTVSIR